jgi:hypothetical protein
MGQVIDRKGRLTPAPMMRTSTSEMGVLGDWLMLPMVAAVLLAPGRQGFR